MIMFHLCFPLHDEQVTMLFHQFPSYRRHISTSKSLDKDKLLTEQPRNQIERIGNHRTCSDDIVWTLLNPYINGFRTIHDRTICCSTIKPVK